MEDKHHPCPIKQLTDLSSQTGSLRYDEADIVRRFVFAEHVFLTLSVLLSDIGIIGPKCLQLRGKPSKEDATLHMSIQIC